MSSKANSGNHGHNFALDGIIAESWVDNFVSGGDTHGMKKFHWMQIALVEEIISYGVKITAMKANKAADIFQKTYISAGMNPTTLSQDEDTNELQTHNELAVYYEGPAAQGAEIFLKFDKPVKTKYIFLQASLATEGRWGFSEVEVMTGEYWLSYCTNDDPLEGIEDFNKGSVSKFIKNISTSRFSQPNNYSFWTCQQDG